jgi:predicted ribonuclease YlaK
VTVEKLKAEDIVGHMTLDKGERSKLADLAAKLF